MTSRATRIREFNRYYTQRIGVLTDHFHGQARPFGEARLLFEIGAEPTTRLGALRARLGLDSGYLSRLLRSLENQGLVAVTTDPADARAKIATLTAAGERELSELNGRSDRTADDLLARLSASQQDQLLTAMDVVQRLLRLSAVTLGPVDPTSAVARDCLATYAAEISQRFPEGYDEGDLVKPAEITRPRGVMLIANENGTALACGAVRTLESGVGELRHMWVRKDARRMGLGRRLLIKLESHAQDLGFHTLRLGTHEVLTEAVAMYRTLGYEEIPPYRDDPHDHHCFMKRINR